MTLGRSRSKETCSDGARLARLLLGGCSLSVLLRDGIVGHPHLCHVSKTEAGIRPAASLLLGVGHRAALDFSVRGGSGGGGGPSRALLVPGFMRWRVHPWICRHLDALHTAQHRSASRGSRGRAVGDANVLALGPRGRRGTTWGHIYDSSFYEGARRNLRAVNTEQARDLAVTPYSGAFSLAFRAPSTGSGPRAHGPRAPDAEVAAATRASSDASEGVQSTGGFTSGLGSQLGMR